MSLEISEFVSLLKTLGGEHIEIGVGECLRFEGRWALLTAGEVRLVAGPEPHDIGLLRAGDLLADVFTELSITTEAIVAQPVSAIVFVPAEIARAASGSQTHTLQLFEHLFEAA